MLEGKLIIIPAQERQNKETSISQAWLAFVLMSKCGNNNEFALLHGGFCFNKQKNGPARYNSWYISFPSSAKQQR